MSALTDLIHNVAAAEDVEAALARLVDGLADRIKATSNDQNIQKLARELKAASPELVETIARKPLPVVAH